MANFIITSYLILKLFMVHSFQIAKRFNGPPNSGNGGYTAGLIAAKLNFNPEITLRVPPPLEQVMQLKVSINSATLMQADTLVAEAKVTDFQLRIPPAITYKEAVEAINKSKTVELSPIPCCFVCGSARKSGDGLAIYPANIGLQKVAAPWIPYENLGDESGKVKTEFIWSALDCPGAWAIQDTNQFYLLGRMAVKEVLPIKVNEQYIIMGWVLKTERRKTWTGTAIYNKVGEISAFAKATWISVRQ